MASLGLTDHFGDPVTNATYFGSFLLCSSIHALSCGQSRGPERVGDGSNDLSPLGTKYMRSQIRPEEPSRRVAETTDLSSPQTSCSGHPSSPKRRGNPGEGRQSERAGETSAQHGAFLIPSCRPHVRRKDHLSRARG